MEANHDDVVRRSFDGQRWLFAGPDSPFAQRATTTMSWLEPLDPDMLVLDVACGAAHVAELAAPHVRQVVGIDLTRTLIDVGAQRLREAGVPNVLLQVGNAADLPFVDATFDLVVSRYAFHHLADPARTLAEMARVCRPGGRVTIADMVAPTVELRDRFDELHRTLDPSHARAMLEHELASAMEQTVGPISYGATTSIEFTFGPTVPAALMDALRAELDGGASTGFRPAAVGDEKIEVSFIDTVVHATRV